MARRRWLGVLLLAAACGHEPASERPPPAPPSAELPAPRSLDEACARWKCRPSTTVRVQIPKSSPRGWHEITVARSPYSDGKLVRILPGEKLAITGDLRGDQLVNLRLAEGPAADGRDVLLLEFAERPIGAEPSMVFEVHNRFARTVKYHASMQLPERKGFFSTSTCAVLAGKATYEMWPHPIFSLLLREFQFLDEGKSVSCEK